MLADNLILLRGLKGLTQEQAAEIAGVTRQSYSKWEQGETVPDIEKCDRLARHYGVTLDALLHDQNRVGHTALAPAPAGKHLWGAVTLGAVSYTHLTYSGAGSASPRPLRWPIV